MFLLSTLCYILLFSQFVSAASAWGFSDATVSITVKGGGVGGGLKEKYAYYLLPELTSLMMITDSSNAKPCHNLLFSGRPIP